MKVFIVAPIHEDYIEPELVQIFDTYKKAADYMSSIKDSVDSVYILERTLDEETTTRSRVDPAVVCSS